MTDFTIPKMNPYEQECLVRMWLNQGYAIDLTLPNFFEGILEMFMEEHLEFGDPDVSVYQWLEDELLYSQDETPNRQPDLIDYDPKDYQ